MPQRERAENMQWPIRSNEGSQTSVANNINFGRLAKHVAKIGKTEPDKMPDLPRNPYLTIPKKVKEDTPALPMGNETTPENRITSLMPGLKENTTGGLVDTTYNCVNSNHVI